MKLGIIGYPLTHTLSPLLHANLMHRMDLSGEYRKYEFGPEELLSNLQRFQEEDLYGLNVTIPHKVAVMPLMKSLSTEAQLAGAVNTIVFTPDRSMHGYNTDVTGFLKSLSEPIQKRIPGGNFVILGAGGSARAVVLGLIQRKAASISLAIRDPERVVPLVSDAELMKEAFGAQTDMKILPLYELPKLKDIDGLINATPVGMWPKLSEKPVSTKILRSLPKHAFVYDLIYRPLETKLLKAAKTVGLTIMNGLDMLLFQGIQSFELWLNEPVPDDLISVMRSKLEEAVGHKKSVSHE